MLRILPFLLALAMLGGIAAERQSRPAPTDPAPYHAKVRAAVAAIPMRIGDWTGEDVAVPQAAQTLLRPNAIFTRAYNHSARHLRATVVVVQCKDSRDMIGHYPPACYPAHGWSAVGRSVSETIACQSRSIPAERYDYVHTGFDRRSEMVIHAFFVLPGRGIVREMRDVRKASSDYLTRAYGAAQIQVVLDAGLTPDEEAAVFQELVTPLLPMMELLESGPAGAAA